ncbi:hypothetical protein [Carnobacterium antarcticum]|uniref:Uncharacterized protein n=1 Tax=Carnobacterium antarcticum TaxID=2126436 RepID=A0ABW4NNL1_9LACT|nr:hypothetical protein [Carnobacterium sp. CP1]ALV21078.1 hypothetical protein NY10_458 [Carnobacterium sp. CP1]
MILGNLVYMVVRETSGTDFWLNLLSTISTFSAVIISLFFAWGERRLRKQQERDHDNKIKEIISTMLSNANSNFTLYQEEIKKQIKLFPLLPPKVTASFFIENGKKQSISQSAFDKIEEYIDKNIATDALAATHQISILTRLDIKDIPIDIINDYSEAISKLNLLIKWIEDIRDGPKSLRAEEFLKDFDHYYTPTEEAIGKITATCIKT